MNRQELGGPVLAAVSRSFYLTIQLLPEPLRGPIGLTYLLARASDTIADTAQASADLRLEHLGAFERMILDGRLDGLARLQAELLPPAESERRLLAHLGEALEWLRALPAQDRQESQTVLQKIIRGQTLDLQRFGAGEPGQVRALQTAAELDEYTYLVAGCVGEYWTRVCFQHLPDYSRTPPEELCQMGRRYGQGLQLVNILRDLPDDLRHGRCYLPESEVGPPERLLGEPELARPAFNHRLTRAHEHLDEGANYLRALRPARLRMGVFLPWYLGVKTLKLLQAQYPLTAPHRLKVPRRTVYGGMLRALMFSFWNGHMIPDFLRTR